MLIVSNEQRSGSIGATTYARNRFGAYARQRVVPVNPNSERQADARARMGQLSVQWNTVLDASQRTAWNTYAANVSILNRLGQVIHVTGLNMFMRCNSLRLQLGLVLLEDAPSLYQKAEQDPTFTITASEATGLLSVSFNNALGWAIAQGGYMAVFMGSPRQSQVNFFNGPWRYANKIAGAVVPPTTPATMTAPFTLTEGQKIWSYGRIIEADGRVSDPFRDDVLVSA